MSVRSLFPAVHPDERPRLLLAAAAFMCVASAGVVARTAGSAMFLSHYAPSRLAPMYILSAALLMAISFGFGWVVARAPLGRILPATAGILVALSLTIRLATAARWPEASAIAYLFSDLVGKLPAVMFWSFAATMFNPRQAKRLFVIIGAGGTAACVLAGAVIAPFTQALGTENLLIVVALLLAGFGIVIRKWSMAQGASPMATGAMRASAGMRYYKELLALPQVRSIAMLGLISTGALLLTDYLFKSSARAHYVGADLASFFGIFYATSSLTALFVQVFLVHSILRRGGVFAAAAALPAVLLVLSAGAAVTGGFGWAIAAKFADPVLDFTLGSAAMQLLYLGIRKQSRSQARAFVEGIGRPVATALGGVFLVTAASVIAPRALAAVIAVASLVWMLAAWKSYRSYVAGLVESIGVRRFDPADDTVAFGDRIVETHVREAMRTSSDEEVLYLLGLVAHMSEADFRPEFRELLSRDHPEIKVAAIEYLSARGTSEELEWICMGLEHESAKVRTASIHGLASVAKGDVVQEIEHFIHDDNFEVRAAAISEMINIGDLDALLAACINLKEMLRSSDPAARAAAAEALSRVTYAGLSKVLTELLSDTDLPVREAALRACRERPDERLIPSVLQLLSDPDLAVAAAEALAVYGKGVLPHLQSFPDDVRTRPSEATLLIPSVIAQIRDPAALPLLSQSLDAPSVRVRTEVVKAYCDLVATLPAGQRPKAEIRATALREISESKHRDAAIRALAPLENTDLLAHVLEEERSSLLANAFLLLSVLHAQANMRSVLWVLRSGTPEKRAEALEVLDNVLDAEMREAVFSVFEPSVASRAEVAHSLPVERLLREEHSEWIVASAAYTTGRHQTVSSIDSIRELLGDASPYVREAALDALSHLAGPDEIQTAAELVSDDPSPSVRRLAQRLMSEVVR